MAKHHGGFVWFELMTTDPTAAAKFYADVVGLGTQKMDGPMEYWMWTMGGTPVGGLMRLPDEAKKMGTPPSWVQYVGVANMSDAVNQVKALGGQIHVGPRDIPGMGSFAIIGDPQGAVLAMWESTGDQPAPEGMPPIGSVSWHELATTDADAAWKFYSTLFKWEQTSEFDMGPGGMYRMYGQNGIPYGGMSKKGKELEQFPPNWLGYIRVADLDASTEKVKAGGGTVLFGPMEVPDGSRITQALDPQGAYFALHQSKP